jgi:hypothetical protein
MKRHAPPAGERRILRASEAMRRYEADRVTSAAVVGAGAIGSVRWSTGFRRRRSRVDNPWLHVEVIWPAWEPHCLQQASRNG